MTTHAHARENLGVAGRIAAICLTAIMLAAASMSGAFAAQDAAANSAPANGDGALPPKAHELLTLLAQAWLKEQGVTKSATPLAQQTSNSFEDYVNSAAGAIHDQIVALASAIPVLPNEFERAAARVTAVDPDAGKGQVLLDLGIFGDRYYVVTRRLAAEAQAFLNLAVFGAFGFGAQWLFRKMTGRVRRRLDGLPMETVKDRLRLIAARFALAFGVIAAFILGGLGPFLALDWDPVRREMVLGLLIVFVVIRAAVATGDLLLAPNDQRFRIIPTDTVAARFWCRRLTAFAGWFALVWVIIQECDALAFSSEGVELVGYMLGLSVAVMMALAELGVEIGPLIAGASVVGVAIGFGAQSLVRDVIAGIFYLLDDAFRVGEYIQSGTYKGTVESFSIRSVRLRHHRGPVYTVPFSLLGAIQNQSRDWVIDKIAVGVTYDSDIDRASKLIKQIGLDLAKDPEFAPLIIEPLKMQGVDALGDFAVQIRLKMMTLPGGNSAIRRQALAMIKKAFDANGIKFAFPTVQIAGDSDAATAAVAHRALQLVQPANVVE